MSRRVAALAWALVLLLVLARCAFSPDLSRFAPCDEQGGCAPGTTCLASEGICLPDCGAQGPCEPGPPEESDAGGGVATDGGDTGPTDPGTTDAGTTDAGMADAGMADAGPTDAGPTDAGMADAGTMDAGTMDAGPPLRLAGPGILADFPGGKDYDEQLSAVGGQPPYSFDLAPGNTLPAGLALYSDGHVRGNTSATTSSSFEARVTDSAQPQHRVSRSLQLTASSCTPGTTCLRTRTVPDARAGQPYDYGLQANTRMSSVTWAVDSGQLPPGIDLTSAGRLFGTPSTPGRYTFVISLTETLTPTPVKSPSLTLEVF